MRSDSVNPAARVESNCTNRIAPLSMKSRME
jgi:hypothetical protein